MKGEASEELFFELALEDLTRGSGPLSTHLRADRWHGRMGVAGSVPALAHDTASTLAAAKDLFARAARPNLLIKIPGTQEGLPAIEEAIFCRDSCQCHPLVFP